MSTFHPRSVTRTNRRATGRSGFSLLEILMVLAVFFMITAIAIPSVNDAYVGQQLVGAADVVRARFAEARVKSIETGDIYGFFYTPGGGQYFIAPMVQGFQSMQSGAQPSIRQQMLKNRVTFAAGETIQDSRSMNAMENSTGEYSSLRPVLFYPDGTSQDAVILLQSVRGDAVVQVELRGLTGTSSKTNVMDAEAAQQ